MSGGVASTRTGCARLPRTGGGSMGRTTCTSRHGGGGRLGVTASVVGVLGTGGRGLSIIGVLLVVFKLITCRYSVSANWPLGLNSYPHSGSYKQHNVGSSQVLCYSGVLINPEDFMVLPGYQKVASVSPLSGRVPHLRSHT